MTTPLPTLDDARATALGRVRDTGRTYLLWHTGTGWQVAALGAWGGPLPAGAEVYHPDGWYDPDVGGSGHS